MLKKILLTLLLVVLPIYADAAVVYRAEQNYIPSDEPVSLAMLHRFYISGAYNFSMWQSYTDENDVRVSGENTSSFDVALGVRVADMFRVEAQYIRTDAKWDAFSLKGNDVFVNAIFDARIDALYNLIHTQYFVPYVGLGGGVSWNFGDNVNISEKASPVVAGLAGFSLEFGEHFAFDFGYKYIYMFSPKFEGIENLRPNAHQFRAGVRVNF